MAYNLELAQRVQQALRGVPGLVEKKMFGGVAYLVSGNMACGVLGDDLLVRLPPEEHAQALAEAHTRPFAMGNRQPMKGWLLVTPPGHAAEADLRCWVQRGLAFAQTLPGK